MALLDQLIITYHGWDPYLNYFTVNRTQGIIQETLWDILILPSGFLIWRIKVKRCSDDELRIFLILMWQFPGMFLLDFLLENTVLV